MKLHHQLFPALDTQSQNPTIVLIHGLFGNLDNLGLLRKYLNQDYPVLCVDLRNHGKSPWSEEMNYELMSQDVIELLQSLSIPETHLIGHSMGGKTAMAIALQSPNMVLSLTVVDIAPVNYLENRHKDVIAALQRVIDKQVKTRREADVVLAETIEDVSVRQFLLKSFSSEPNRYWQFNVQSIHSHYANIMGWPFSSEQYCSQTLFIKGATSSYLLPEHQTSVQHHFPKAKAHIMNGCGHWLHAEKPEQFHQIVHRFLLNQ